MHILLYMSTIIYIFPNIFQNHFPIIFSILFAMITLPWSHGHVVLFLQSILEYWSVWVSVGFSKHFISCYTWWSTSREQMMQNVPLHVLAITHLMNTYGEQHTKNLRISLNITVEGFCRAKFLAEDFLQTHPGAVVKNAIKSLSGKNPTRFFATAPGEVWKLNIISAWSFQLQKPLNHLHT